MPIGTRLFVTGDVHGEVDYKKIKLFRESMKSELTLDDYLIICGDFGLLWDGGKQDRYFKNIVYGKFPCTVLWVDGNHENFDELYKYPEETWMGGKVHRITDRILHLMRGEIFTLPTAGSEISLFAFGGAKSVDRGYDTGYNKYWWPQELPSQEEMDNALKNLAARNNEVDYIFTHDGPQKTLNSLLALMPPQSPSHKYDWSKSSDEGFSDFLEKLSCTVSFAGWYFGHHHRDISIDKFHCLYNTIKELKPKL